MARNNETPAAQGLNSKYGRYWIRTSDPFRVKEVRYRCANRPHPKSLKHRGPHLRPAAEQVVMAG